MCVFGSCGFSKGHDPFSQLWNSAPAGRGVKASDESDILESVISSEQEVWCPNPKCNTKHENVSPGALVCSGCGIKFFPVR